jgi:sugar/nucleoside kinase (ribokinase family)
LYSKGSSISKFEFDPIKEIHDATGAGDAFSVSLSVSLFQKQTIEDAIKHAIFCAQCMCKTQNKNNIALGEWKIF